MEQNILTILGIAITLSEIAIAIYKYSEEAIRKKRYDTINVYNELFENIYLLREKYYEKFTGTSLFEHSNISSDKELYKLIMNELTKWESFARGLEYEIYDFDIYIHLAPKELCDIFKSLSCFVDEESKNKKYDLLFSDFQILCTKTILCVQNKIDKKTLPKKYRKVGLK